jgi:hypothetical protein
MTRTFGRIVAVVAAIVVVVAARPGAASADGGFNPNLGPGETITVTPAQWPPVYPSSFPQAPHVGFHEFQVDCPTVKVSNDNPVDFPGQPGADDSYTYVSATTANAFSTTASLLAGGTSCPTVDDHSAYWFPTMTNNGVPVLPHAIIYYKAGIKAYNTIRAFPPGLRFKTGSDTATAAQFLADSGSSGWSCGSSYNNASWPAFCPPGSQLIVRYQAPSCWDGVNLDTPDHQSMMAYPVKGVCPASHPVALPMLEYKIVYPVSGDMSKVTLSSGPGYTWHAYFFSAWSMPTQESLVTQCVNGGGQCNALGYDQHLPGRGSVLQNLNGKYYLIPGVPL